MVKDFFRIVGVSKKLRSQEVLKNVNLSVQKGELWGILGPSGVGKTTLLRLIAGFGRPDEGRIILDGEDITDQPASRRPVNTVFQSYALFPHLNVLDNVFFGLRFEKICPEEKRARVFEILEILSLTELAHHYPDQLSGGQKQRVAIARCLVKRPKILLLDEPFSALDKVLRERIQMEVRSIFQELKVTCLYVTHDQQSALNISTHMAILGGSSVQQSGPSQLIYDFPKTVYVARFLGDMNIFSGTVIGRKDHYTEVEMPGECSVAYVTSQALCDDDVTVCFGVRPERMLLAKTKPDQRRNVVRGHVLKKVFRGREVIYEVVVKGHSPHIRVINLPGEACDIEVGQEVWVYWSDNAGVLLRL